MPKLTEQEKKVLQALIEGIPFVSRPYAEIGKRLGLTEDEVIRIIQGLLEQGVIRRLGATLRHNLAGYEGNAMVAWQVPDERIDEVGKRLAEKPFVSHCYVRETYPDWNYNLYTMCHAKSLEELKALIEDTAKELGLTEYQILATKQEIRRKHARYHL